MSAPVKPSPAPFDARQLADTLDTMGLLVASLSDRIDAQGRMLEQVLKTATEARAAAFAAERATDWKRNGDLINEGIVRGNRRIEILATMTQGQQEAMDRVLREMRPLIAVTTRGSWSAARSWSGCGDGCRSCWPGCSCWAVRWCGS